MLNGFFFLFLALQSSSARATDLLVFSQYINLFMFMSIPSDWWSSYFSLIMEICKPIEEEKSAMCVKINLSKFYLNYLIYFSAFLSELRIFIIVNRRTWMLRNFSKKKLILFGTQWKVKYWAVLWLMAKHFINLTKVPFKVFLNTTIKRWKNISVRSCINNLQSITLFKH